MQARIINLFFFRQLELTCLSLSCFQEFVSVFKNCLGCNPDSENASQPKNFIEYLKKRVDEEN